MQILWWAVLALASSVSVPPTPVKSDPLTWLRADQARFACFLETNFGTHDPIFRCGARLSAKLKRADRGPQFPVEKSAEVNLLVSKIELEWEHGELRQVTLTLPRKMSRLEVWNAFHYPDDAHRPANVMSIDVQDCSQKETCVLLQGFDHQGPND